MDPPGSSVTRVGVCFKSIWNGTGSLDVCTQTEVDEDFSEAVFRFTRGAYSKFLPGLGDRLEPESEAADVFKHWRERMRQRREQALGFTQYLLQGETMDNVDADLLAAVYNASHPEFL